MSNLPTLINWSITNKCNLSCDFCFRLLDKDIDYQQMNEIVDIIIKAGVKRVTFTGGEPLYIEGISLLADRLRFNDIFCSLHTNCTLISKLKQVYRSFNRISLSLDGHNSEINELMRKRLDYFSIILEIMHFLKQNQHDFAIKTVVTKKNIESIPLMSPIIDEYAPTFWSLFEFRPLRIGNSNNIDFMLNEHDFDNLIPRINCKTTINSFSNNESNSYPIFLISGNGNVYTNSPINGDIQVGNILEESITSIWKRIINLNSLTVKHLQKYNVITGGKQSV